jgi:hypothetical protein
MRHLKIAEKTFEIPKGRFQSKIKFSFFLFFFLSFVIYLFLPFLVLTSPYLYTVRVGGLYLNTLNKTHSVGLLRTKDRPVRETRDNKQHGGIRTRRPTSQTARPVDSANEKF